jgi:hypothetical protein
VVQIGRRGNVRNPVALLCTKGSELAVEGSVFLAQAADAAEAGAPGMRKDPRWTELPLALREDPEIRAAWAVQVASEARLERARGGGGELDAMDGLGRATAQLGKILRERGGISPPARAAPVRNVRPLAVSG